MGQADPWEEASQLLLAGSGVGLRISLGDAYAVREELSHEVVAVGGDAGESSLLVELVGQRALATLLSCMSQPVLRLNVIVQLL